MSKLVRVELGPEGNVVRIFRNKNWLLLPDGCVQLMDRGVAVGLIRKQVFARCKNPLTGHFECGRCGCWITEEFGEMNEKRPKGASGGFTGGEISISNCEALCHNCHTGSPDSAHGNRRWQTSKLRDPNV